MQRPFRFGVNLVAWGDGGQWREKCRRAEQLGYDVLLVPDHLGEGLPVPFPALVAAAAVTERPRLGTFVLNAGLWNAMLLAREVDTTARLTDGRLELGLRAQRSRGRRSTLGISRRSRGSAEELGRRATAADRFADTVVHRRARQRVLRLAATHADTVAFSGLQLVPGSSEGKLRPVSMGEFDERADLVTRTAGEREPERNVLVQWVEITDDAHGSVERLCADKNLDVGPDELLRSTIVLVGEVDEIVDQVRACRERLGVSYFVVHEHNMETFAPVLNGLSGQ